MKKMVIIDVPDDFETKDAIAIVDVQNEKGEGVIAMCPLKPMPLKRETHVYWKSVGIGNIPTHEISDYDKGWNDCVEFLEGDMQDD